MPDIEEVVDTQPVEPDALDYDDAEDESEPEDAVEETGEEEDTGDVEPETQDDDVEDVTEEIQQLRSVKERAAKWLDYEEFLRSTPGAAEYMEAAFQDVVSGRATAPKDVPAPPAMAQPLPIPEPPEYMFEPEDGWASPGEKALAERHNRLAFKNFQSEQAMYQLMSNVAAQQQQARAQQVRAIAEAKAKQYEEREGSKPPSEFLPRMTAALLKASGDLAQEAEREYKVLAYEALSRSSTTTRAIIRKKASKASVRDAGNSSARKSGSSIADMSTKEQAEALARRWGLFKRR